jgi:hypothetical protein
MEHIKNYIGTLSITPTEKELLIKSIELAMRDSFLDGKLEVFKSLKGYRVEDIEKVI